MESFESNQRRQLTNLSNAAITAEVRVSTPSFMKMFGDILREEHSCDHKIGDGKKLGAWLHFLDAAAPPSK